MRFCFTRIKRRLFTTRDFFQIKKTFLQPNFGVPLSIRIGFLLELLFAVPVIVCGCHSLCTPIMNSFRLTNVATTALLLMLGLWVKTVSANNITWSGCGPIEDPLTRLKVDQRTVICLHVGNTEDWGGQVTYLRLSFSPKIDQYSRFHVSNCKSIVA